MRLHRRQLLSGAGALLASRLGHAAESKIELEERELEVPGERLSRRCLLLVPKAPAGRDRLLVLCHGLGETHSEAVGIRAWADRYGLVSAHARLRRPPVVRTLKDAVYLTDERLRDLNEALARHPYEGLVVACPFTPNVFRQPSTPAALDHYAAWLADGVLPAIQRELGFAGDRPPTAIDGVSLGGYVSLEVFLRRPEAFDAVGSTQGAFGTALADAYGARFERAFARVGPRPVRVATSGWDKGRPASERLASRLQKKGIDARLRVTPGPHDQRWLREAGSLELLFDYANLLPHAPRVIRGGA